MEKRKELVRLVELGVFLCAVFGAFLLLLYNLQVVHGDDYAARTVKTVGKAETVSAARGELLDRYGRSLVTNQVVYQVTLDVNSMGSGRNDTILALLELARAHGISWPDSLPIGQNAPYSSRLLLLSQSAQSNYAELARLLKWPEEPGPALLDKLREYYKVSPDVSDADARALVGVLYELSLRSRDVLWSSYVFASDVDIDFISAVREHSLSGVNISPVATRKYAVSCAAHILGRTGAMDKEEWQVYKEQGYAMNETVGKDGAEQAFESVLRGESGVRVVERSASGKIVNETWRTRPVPGGSVCLTIDLPLQEKLEEVLAAGIPTLTEDVRGGAAALVDVHSGAVLAMASYPTFDLAHIYSDAKLYSQVASDELNPLYNRATMGLYSPGSTFKMVTAAAALEEGIIEPNTRILDTGTYDYYTRPGPACWYYKDYRRTHGLISVSRAIEVSCNVFFYDVGRRVGIRTLGDYAHKFGLGLPTGIEIPEKQGTVAGPDYTESLGKTWYEGSVLSAAIGQENNQFTPLQLANYTATLANGGTHYAAHLLKCVKSSDFTQTLETYEPKVLDSIQLQSENLAAIKKGMLDLATTGSLGKYFRDLDFQVGAKTGTAQVSGSATANAVFVCFAPFDDPQVALAIVAERGGSGSDLAGLAAQVLDFYFHPQSPSSAVEENTLLP